MWIFYLMPIIVHLLILPFWFVVDGIIVSLIEWGIGAFISPVYLIIVSYKAQKKKEGTIFLVQLCILVGISILGNLIYYFNWGIYTGCLLLPDSGTISFIQAAIVISIVISVMGLVLIYKIKNKN